MAVIGVEHRTFWILYTPIPRFMNEIISIKTVRKVKTRKSKMKLPLISM
jgi:hypothetical protein